MADRLATLLGTECQILVFEELLVAQDDIRSIGKSVDTLLMELDQQALEAYLSSASKGSATGRARKTGSPKLSPEHAVDTSSAKKSPEAIEPHHGDLPAVVGGSSPPVKRSRNAERRQRRRERRQLMAAATTPSSPLDLSHVSYDKCVASLQSRSGPIRADDKLDFKHNWTSVHMNNDSDAPIIGHTHENFRDAQRTNCKKSRSKQALGLMRASRAGHARADARISGQRDARVQAWGRRVYPLHAPVDGVQASQSHLDQQLQHSTAPKCSREGAWHTTNQPKRPEQTRRTHLSSKKMRASGAQEAQRVHLLAHKDARVPHTARASGGDTRLLPSNSSAIGGSTPLRTNVGGSVLPKTDNRSSISPQTYEHDRPAQQEPSTRRKGRPRRRKSSQTRTAQLDPSTSPGPDLREQLSKKRRADQVTPHCRCEKIIASVLADYTCSSPAQTKSVFERLSATSSAELTKRLCFNDEDMPSEDEFIEVSVNMVDKDMGKQPALEPKNSATPGIYMRTRSRSGTIRPVNYRALEQGQEKPKEHSAIVDSYSWWARSPFPCCRHAKGDGAAIGPPSSGPARPARAVASPSSDN